MRALLARLLRSLTSTTLSAQLAGMLIGGILFLHGVATFTVQLVEERQAARSALLEQANSLALSLQLLHSEPFEYKRSLLERLERLDVVHLSLSDAPNPARQARDERALYLRDRLRKNLNSIETDLDTREMLTEVQRVHVADSMNPTLRRHVPWTHVYESRVSVRLDDGKWLCVVISSDAYDFSPSQASLTMLLLEAGLLILLILVVVHRVVRPLRVLSGKAESFGRNLYTAPLPEDGPTEVREAARAFNKMQERIRAGVGQHERILAAVAHDLRTPLTSISGSADILLSSGEALSPSTRQNLYRDIHEDAEWLIRIVENLLSITRINNSEEARVKKAPEAAEEVIEGAVAKTHKHYPDVDIRVTLPDELMLVPMDPLLIEQVLVNLMENAVIHGETHCIDVMLRREGDNAVFEVSDDGKGIPLSLLPRLFDGAARSDRRSDGKRSMGIGLSVCRTVVQAHGGTIRGDNKREGGACFTVTLPMKGDDNEDQG